MSTIVTINQTDIIANSRSDLNTNFANLNADKLEGPSASIDSEIALFSGTGGKTVKRASVSGFLKAASGVLSAVASIVEGDLGLTDITTANVSSSVHGFAPKSPADATKFLNGATGPAYAQVKDSDLATTDVTSNDVTTAKHGFTPKAPNDTAKFLRGDGTWAALPSAPSATSLVPYPADGGFSTTTFNNNTNTTGAVFAFSLPYAMVVNKISINVTAVGTSGTLKLGVFSQDGQTQYISITTASISGTGIISTTVGTITLPAGVYYFIVIPVGTAAITLTTWTQGVLEAISGKSTHAGTYTVTASTMPATITIASIGAASSPGALMRLDN